IMNVLPRCPAIARGKPVLGLVLLFIAAFQAPAMGQTDVPPLSLNVRVISSSPAIADITLAGVNDIVVVAKPAGGNGYFVYVLNGAANYASQLPGWPQLIDPAGAFYPGPPAAVGDVNFDSRPDILVGGYSNGSCLGCGGGGAGRSVYAFNSDGTTVAG